VQWKCDHSEGTPCGPSTGCSVEWLREASGDWQLSLGLKPDQLTSCRPQRRSCSLHRACPGQRVHKRRRFSRQPRQRDTGSIGGAHGHVGKAGQRVRRLHCRPRCGVPAGARPGLYRLRAGAIDNAYDLRHCRRPQVQHELFLWRGVCLCLCDLTPLPVSVCAFVVLTTAPVATRSSSNSPSALPPFRGGRRSARALQWRCIASRIWQPLFRRDRRMQKGRQSTSAATHKRLVPSITHQTLFAFAGARGTA
jgi:hypothetical protein